MSRPASLSAGHFEALYREDPDPWRFATSPYERAKYDRTIAALGGRRARHGLELGCSIGVLTKRLAAHCRALTACDAAPTAVAATRARTARLPQVRVVECVLPALPPGSFDLVVASEVLYYLDDADLVRTLVAIDAALAPGGTLLAVHWIRPTRTHPQQGDHVHDLLRRRPMLEHTLGERHPDYRLDRFTRR